MVFLPVFNDLYDGEMKSSMNPVIINGIDNYYRALDKVATTDSKTAVIAGETHIRYLNQQNSISSDERRKKIKYEITRERLIMYPSVIYTRKSFYLSDVTNGVIEQLKTSGLIDYWQKQTFSKQKLDTTGAKHQRRQPEVIKFEHVKGPFQFLVIGLVVSFLVFMIEIFHKKLAFMTRRTLL